MLVILLFVQVLVIWSLLKVMSWGISQFIRWWFVAVKMMVYGCVSVGLWL